MNMNGLVNGEFLGFEDRDTVMRFAYPAGLVLMLGAKYVEMAKEVERMFHTGYLLDVEDIGEMNRPTEVTHYRITVRRDPFYHEWKPGDVGVLVSYRKEHHEKRVVFVRYADCAEGWHPNGRAWWRYLDLDCDCEGDVVFGLTSVKYTGRNINL